MRIRFEGFGRLPRRFYGRGGGAERQGELVGSGLLSRQYWGNSGDFFGKWFTDLGEISLIGSTASEIGFSGLAQAYSVRTSYKIRVVELYRVILPTADWTDLIGEMSRLRQRQKMAARAGIIHEWFVFTEKSNTKGRTPEEGSGLLCCDVLKNQVS